MLINTFCRVFLPVHTPAWHAKFEFCDRSARFDCQWIVVPQSYLLLEHLCRRTIGTVLRGAFHCEPAKMPDSRLVYTLSGYATAGQGGLTPASRHLKIMPEV